MTISETEIESQLRNGENEGALRLEFGDLLYEDLASLARRMDDRAPMLEHARRKVFILPGIMGSKLSVVQDGVQNLIWIDPVDIINGGVSKLRLGSKADPVAATGTVLTAYLRMRLRLRLAGYDAAFLPYDWRLAPAVSGSALLASLRRQGLSDVTLVGHSMGGLVARAMAGDDPGADIISRVVTIGTPNRGSYAPVEIFALTHDTLGKLALADLRNSASDIATDVLRHFPGLLQMMPYPDTRPGEDYFASTGWPNSAVRPLKSALTQARAALDDLPSPDARFFQIVGYDEDTVVGARQHDDSFLFTLRRDGDGTVPRDLAEMGAVPRYYTKGAHGALCNRGAVIAATIDLIGTGITAQLPDQRPLVATENAPETKITAEALAARRDAARTSPPLRETDFAGTFLSADIDLDPGEAPEMVISETGRGEVRRAAAPLDLLDDVRARYDASRSERTYVTEKLQSEQPLETESPTRLRAYTERLLTEVKAADRPADRVIIAGLEEAVRKTEILDDDADQIPREDSIFLERVIGEAEEFLSVMFFKRAAQVTAAVGRIVGRNDRRGFGTGFMIAPGVLMTNEHVLRNIGDASRSSVQFLFELEIDSREIAGHVFDLEPARLFWADPALDMAIVAVSPLAQDGASLGDFGHLPLVSAEGKIRKGQPVNIVQHPLGGRKQVVFRESLLTALPQDSDHVAHYTGDTQPGSSGSPVFSDRWEVVALHHSGVPATDENGNFLNKSGDLWNRDADPEVLTLDWVANEGIRISRIMRVLAALPAELEAMGAPGADLVRDVVKESERATVEGIFSRRPGGFGRESQSRRVNTAVPPPQVRQDRVLQSATGDSQTTSAIVTVPLQIKIGISVVPNES